MMLPQIYTKRIRLTFDQKVAIVKKAKSAPDLTYNELSEWSVARFELLAKPNKSTIGRVLRDGEKLLLLPVDAGERKKRLPSRRASLDQHVVEFIMLAELENTALTGAMIIHQAQELAKKMKLPAADWPRFGPSWLRRLQERYGFRWRRAFGESDSADMDGAKEELARLKSIVACYTTDNVFNMDESAFFYKAVPRGSICRGSAPALKQNKARVTMAVCSNASGSEKLPLLFLGTAAKPL